MPHPHACDVQDRRPVLVLLHAFPLDRRMWRAQGEALADRAHILAPDLPGFGTSAEVAAPPRLDDWADLLEQLLVQSVGRRPVVVCGLSMGGYLALRLAARHPGRLDALVLADTWAGADEANGRAARDQRIAQVGREGVEPLVDSLLPRLFSRSARPEIVAAARQMMVEQNPAGVVAALTAMRDRPCSLPVLPRIAVPTLVVVGAADDLTAPTLAEEMAVALPNGRLRLIPDAGHLANLESPWEFNRALAELLEEVATCPGRGGSWLTAGPGSARHTAESRCR